MDNDFNTSQALAYLFSLAKRIHKAVAENHKDDCGKYTKALQVLSEVLGLVKIKRLSGIATNHSSAIATINNRLSNDELETKIEERRSAKQNKDWSAADKIRDELKKDGIVLKDEKDGTTSWEIID